MLRPLLAALLLLLAAAAAPALSVTLTWDAAVPQAAQLSPEGYVLTRNGAEVLRTTATQATDPLPGPGTFLYTVQATAQGTVSAPSNAVTVTTPLLTCAYLPVDHGFTVACRDPAFVAPPGPYPRLAVGLVTVQAADSQETVGEDGRATNAVDGLRGTMWHTQWLLASPPLPHSLALDLGLPQWVDGVAYLPRQTGGLNGTITSYRLDASTDLTTWRTITSGTWALDLTEKVLRFPALQARYVRLVGLVSNGTPYASAAEVGVYAVGGTP
jgi:hypothetical protein